MRLSHLIIKTKKGTVDLLQYVFKNPLEYKPGLGLARCTTGESIN